jgi:hypothetical protein
MQPLLIPARHPDEQLTSLLQGVITRQYSYGGSRYFFVLYPEPGPELIDSDTSGRYLVVLNSVDGTHAFYLEQNEAGEFIKEEEDFWDEPEELTTENMIMEVEGVHVQREEPLQAGNRAEETYDPADGPELVEDPAYKEVNLRLAHWVNNGAEDLVLPLINAALKEFGESRK